VHRAFEAYLDGNEDTLRETFTTDLTRECESSHGSNIDCIHRGYEKRNLEGLEEWRVEPCPHEDDESCVAVISYWANNDHGWMQVYHFIRTDKGWRIDRVDGL
jgi:hypothetical protein